MSTAVEKIKAIEDEMAKTQKNKATAFHLGQLKAKLAKLKRELLTPSSGGGGGGGVGFDVARTGVASVGFVGFPSVGKSSLMSGLTGTTSAVAAYEFTTLTTVPGTMSVRGASVQILDLPGIIEGAKDGKGRGRQVIAVARSCNLLFIVLDVLKPLDDKRIIENELEVIIKKEGINKSIKFIRPDRGFFFYQGFGIRLNKKPPNIQIKKKDKGGISISNTVPLTNLETEEIKAVLAEYRMSNADVGFRCDATLDELIDVIEGNRVYMPCLYVLNKIDAISIEELDLIYRIPNSVPISVKEWLNIDELIDCLWDKLDLVRVYTKPRGKQPDYSQPIVLKRNKCSVEDFCNAIHKEISKQMKYCGTSAKHARGQKVGLDHILEDEDVVTSLPVL
ncbi:P-loop containing nucleoside triphosphate hydrolase protein [Phakopsora pachyrhizi]|nr:P-loop containing nucleoside triphosphate hydrolase protein [Phakopsora pachyrhizi]